MKIIINISKIILLVLLSFISIRSQDYVPGQIYYGRNNYVEYHAGNVPLIFSAPHGGNLTPSEIPDRTSGTLVTDSYTKETTIAIKEAVYNFTGHYPHIIIVNLKRIKLDANREIVEGAAGNQWAEIAWNEFHDFIEIAKDTIINNFGRGLYADIHGHGHEIKRLELGYLLSTNDLFLTDNELNDLNYRDQSSLKYLASTASSDFASLIRGSKSLGTLFEENGISAVPSQSQPNPGVGNLYFSGGYDTFIHGSRNEGTIDGVQIEAYKDGLRDTESNRAFYAQTITKVFDEYLQEHYGWDGIITNVDIENSNVPTKYQLSQNYPNPFNPTTTISYSIPQNAFVSITIYDLLGRVVKTLVNESKSAGSYNINFNASGISSGIYYYTIKANSFIETKKLVVLK